MKILPDKKDEWSVSLRETNHGKLFCRFFSSHVFSAVTRQDYIQVVSTYEKRIPYHVLVAMDPATVVAASSLAPRGVHTLPHIF